MAVEHWIAFDFDGTINDSFLRHAKVLQHVYPEVGNIEQWDRRLIETKRRGGSTRQFLEEIGAPEPDNISQEWTRLIEDPAFLAYDNPYPDALPVIRSLSERAPLLLCTARQFADGVHSQLKRFDLDRLFRRICVVTPGKGAGLRKAAETRELQLHAVIGDTEDDLTWSRELKCRFIAVDWGFREHAFWRSRGVTPVGKWSTLYNALDSGAVPLDAAQ